MKRLFRNLTRSSSRSSDTSNSGNPLFAARHSPGADFGLPKRISDFEPGTRSDDDNDQDLEDESGLEEARFVPTLTTQVNQHLTNEESDAEEKSKSDNSEAIHGLLDTQLGNLAFTSATSEINRNNTEGDP
jgi:hypothetical protein